VVIGNRLGNLWLRRRLPSRQFENLGGELTYKTLSKVDVAIE
jgi:hypothetical protein